MSIARWWSGGPVLPPERVREPPGPGERGLPDDGLPDDDEGDWDSEDWERREPDLPDAA